MSQVFFCVSGFLLCLCVCYEHSKYVSHIRIYAYHGYVISLQKGNPHTRQSPEYDIRPSDDEASVLELLGMWNILSLPLLPGHLEPER